MGQRASGLQGFGVAPFIVEAPTVHDLRGLLPTRPGRPYYQRPLEGITGVTLHYTASPVASGVEAVRAIARYQVGPDAQEAFPAIAYSLIVTGDGMIYQCHDLSIRTWHSGAVVGGVARNASHIGICYVGDDRPNDAQIAGLRQAILWCDKQLIRLLAVEGHRDSYPTKCPGETWTGLNGWNWDVIRWTD